MEKMKAVICTRYGPPEVLQIREVEKPIPKDNEVLIKIHATAVTASDCVIRGLKMPGAPGFLKKHLMRLMVRIFMGFSKPRNSIIGLVMSGEVESVGKNITQFSKGDEVYGFTPTSLGNYAEYKCMSENAARRGYFAIKPGNIGHEEAAAIAYGGVLAIYFMRKMTIQSGHKVLVYGASGAIGTIAVQLARHSGAEVTGVCSQTNIELVKSLGADKVIDYTREDSTEKLESYDFILDAVGKNKSSKLKTQCKKALHQDGKYVSVDDGLHKLGSEDLAQLTKIVEAGHIRAVIDSHYPLEQIVEAHRYVDKGHKKGNVVIRV
ncbi:NAD(P)-dependent alcohol dehydrogenase [Fulvivirgaceae bacterium BMA12]|uniref:NAD(P)-dependent alcohol dehydrogenase n=1 Tax=Agaribacillus aureus TaxID=3051825 RepID=A0ABT8LGK6_9BACT|nr:NAD(P)-dependent alcohol dehydrogenase [Fulvivirgaceae bacterium BMA12]